MQTIAGGDAGLCFLRLDGYPGLEMRQPTQYRDQGSRPQPQPEAKKLDIIYRKNNRDERKLQTNYIEYWDSSKVVIV